MDFFGIGPLELLFVILLMLIVMGPKEMVRSGAALGRLIRQMIRSPTWRVVQETSRRLRNLPNTLVQEAGIEDFEKEIREVSSLPDMQEFDNISKEDLSLDAWTKPADGRAAWRNRGATPKQAPKEPSEKSPDDRSSVEEVPGTDVAEGGEN